MLILYKEYRKINMMPNGLQDGVAVTRISDIRKTTQSLHWIQRWL
jgi:hypothetical protein